MSAGFRVITPNEREMDKTTRCYVLYEAGYWMVAGLGSLERSTRDGALGWGWDKRCEAREATCVTDPGNFAFRLRVGFGQDSIQARPQGDYTVLDDVIICPQLPDIGRLGYRHNVIFWPWTSRLPYASSNFWTPGHFTAGMSKNAVHVRMTTGRMSVTVPWHRHI